MMAWMDRASRVVIGGLERFFRWWGGFVARWPYTVIIICLAITSLSSIGLLRLRMEHKVNLLWIPPWSIINTNEAWLDKHFKNNDRTEMILYESKNVLTPTALKEMLELHRKITEISINGFTFSDICTRISIADIFQTKRRRRRQVEGEGEDEDNDYDDIWEDYQYQDSSDEGNANQVINFSKYGKQTEETGQSTSGEDLPRDIYCDLVTTLQEKCMMSSLLEMWRFDEANIQSANQQEILNAVNMLTKSPWFGHERNFSSLLGGIERNSTGHIVAARTSIMIWSVKVPDNVTIVNSQGSGTAPPSPADKTTLDWEEAFIKAVLNSSWPGSLALPHAERSFGDISSDAIFSDAGLMAGGYILMFGYTILMLGQWNSLEIRLYLSVAGLLGIAMGMVIALGLSSVLGFPYTPIHSMLSFIFLAIGIDDIFVIVQCWTNLSLDKPTSIPDKMGLALQHAGVSITVTSLTDIFAFGIGSISWMPGVASFCVCTSLGLTAIFLLQVSWFVAWMSLDEARVVARRDGVLPCVVHDKESKGKGCTTDRQRRWTLGTIYRYLLSSNLLKALVIAVTLGVFGAGACGCSLMRVRFDPMDLIPSDSYLRQLVEIRREFYPGKNWFKVDIYSGTVNHSHLSSIDRLVTGLEQLQEEGILNEVDSWWTKMKEYAEDKANFTNWHDFATEDKFQLLLSDFLFSSLGAKYKPNFKFDSPLECNQPAPRVVASKFDIRYHFLDGPEEHIPARRAVTALLEDVGPPYKFSLSVIYPIWEGDEIIGFELIRNILLIMAGVFLVTLVLLTNLQMCAYLIVILIITLTDIVGFLHYWDTTIDIVSYFNIFLAIGLVIDYSVHVGLAFMVAKGSRKEKAEKAVTTIGPAVLNGGVTTFIAFLLCGLSSSHSFQTFFKVFMLTVAMGLFHGLVLFPVLLSLVGPAPEAASVSVTESGANNIAFTKEVPPADDSKAL